MLTKDKQIKSRVLAIVGHPVAADTEIFKGALTVLNEGSLAVPATRAEGLRAAGIARKGVDNTGGQDGEKIVEVRKDESPKLKNDAANPVTREHIGQPCYILDDETVTSLADGSSVAGAVEDVDDSGVWISFS
jgi:hypothetical protein